MAYQVTLKKGVLKTLVTINEPYYSSIKIAIYALADDPRPNGYKKLKGRDSYRIRVGIYRVIYNIYDNQLIVDVIELGHRKDIYD